MKYIIECYALGYEATTLTVEAQSLAEARKSERLALDKWEQVNDVERGTREMAFTNINRVKN